MALQPTDSTHSIYSRVSIIITSIIFYYSKILPNDSIVLIWPVLQQWIGPRKEGTNLETLSNQTLTVYLRHASKYINIRCYNSTDIKGLVRNNLFKYLYTNVSVPWNVRLYPAQYFKRLRKTKTNLYGYSIFTVPIYIYICTNNNNSLTCFFHCPIDCPGCNFERNEMLQE